MNCMNDCKNNTLCRYFQDVQKTLNEGLRTQDLSAGDNGKTTFSYAAVFSALARSCNKYAHDDQNLSKEKIEELASYATKIANQLKTDQDFILEFLNSKSPEHRIELIKENLDEDQIEALELDYQDTVLKILREFGF